MAPAGHPAGRGGPGALYPLSGGEGGARALLRRLERAAAVLHGAQRSLGTVAAATGGAGDPAARGPEPARIWFEENFYIIEAQIRDCRKALGDEGAPLRLPLSRDGKGESCPRIYLLMRDLIGDLAQPVDMVRLSGWIRSAQEAGPENRLALRELWAVPLMLRIAVLVRLAPVARAVAARSKAGGAVESGALAAGAESLSALQQDALDRARAAFASLRLFAHTDWSRTVEELSVVETILRRDPGAVYARTDPAGRNRMRNEVAALARRAGIPEWQAAEAAVAQADAAAAADHDAPDRGAWPGAGGPALVAHWLIGEGRPALEDALGLRPGLRLRAARFARRHVLGFHLGPIGLITLLMVVSALPVIWRLHPLPAVLVTLALAIGASHLAVALVNAAVTFLLAPRALLRLDFSQGIPDACRTLVAVPCMLTSPRGIADLAQALELRCLGNRDDNLFFALLSDFGDAATREMPQDGALLSAATNAIEALNARHAGDGPPRFALFHRERRWNPAEGCWMGWERKRGKLIALNRFLRGRQDADCRLLAGDAAVLRGCAFVITLDADTALPPETGRRLVATLAHPMNRAVWDENAGRVVAGYGVLQPRVSMSGACKGATRLARLFAGEVGLDPYSGAVSDVYQDLYGEASFIGKGIYDIDIFARATGERFPENMILSHDLLEGNFARAGLVSDIDLHEDYPESYATDLRRRHRWTRGDWQIAPWLLPFVPGPGGTWRRNPLDAHHRWKILDNLRRSLVPVALLVLLLHGWLAGPHPGYWTMIVLMILFAPPLLLGLHDWMRRDPRMDRALHRRLTAEATRRRLAQTALPLAMLPCEAAFSLDAIIRSLWRLLVSRRRLLEWQTASAAARRAETDFGGFVRLLWPGPALALAVGCALLAQGGAALPVAAPFLLVWAGAPALALWLGRRPKPERQVLPDRGGQRWLGGVARRHWHYFELAVGPCDHGLPCDNLQARAGGVPEGEGLEGAGNGKWLRSHRTSPTNIGLYLAAVLTARDFGYLTGPAMQTRIGETLDTLERLPRFRGHFLNWYDTQDLAPLAPAYVSTVDSGNLLACLLVVARGLEEAPPSAVVAARMWSGLRDTWQVLSEALVRGGGARVVKAAPWAAVAAALEQPPITDAPPAQQEQRLARLSDSLDRALAHRAPPEAARWLCRLRAQVEAWQIHLGDKTGADAASRAGRELARRCRALAAMDFDFLWQPEQRLLSIGYDVTRGEHDASSYDLLASEARLASFVAIAQGRLPRDHWLALGRPLVAVEGSPTLVSWGGTMFEYLMPQLFMPEVSGSLLTRSCRNAVAFHIAHGRRLGLPWGVSESAYNRVDERGFYQYRSFGVPGLGFRRGLARDRVVAPYASALALMLRPRAALANLRRLEKLGALAEAGFYEALDFTPDRLRDQAFFVMVKSHMAHHQGMVLLALSALLNDRPMQRRFLREPMFRAHDILLHEKMPVAPVVGEARAGAGHA